VELAGALAEAARLTLPHDFRHIDTRTTRVILVEGQDRLLPALPAALGERARKDLEAQGVDVRLSTRVDEIAEEEVRLGEERIPAQNVIWAAGVGAGDLLRHLGPETDRAGRLVVGADLTLPGHPEVFVLGDAAHVEDPATGRPVPGLAPAAIQMGNHAAKTIAREARGGTGPRPPFRYRDKGDMAVISRGKAVARLRSWHLGGFPAWVVWALVHIYFLIGFRRRLLVFLEWVWSFLFYVRGTRLITGDVRPRLRRPR
jgi:NADH dehydrogenase